MNAEQKRAWLGIWTMVVCVVGYVALYVMFSQPFAAFAAFGFYGVNGLAGLIGRGERIDERDRAIAKKASMAGFVASYEAFIVGCMGTWFYVYLWQGGEAVLVHALPLITMLGGMVFYFVRCLAILVLYGWPMEADHA